MVTYSNSGKVSGSLVLMVLMGFLVINYSDAVPNREILKSSRKVNSSEKNPNIAEGKICTTEISSIINPIISLVTTIPSTIISFIGNLTSGAADGLGSLFTKPSFGGGLGGLFNFTLPNKNSTSSCNLIDPLILVNLPGIFIAVPLVIIGIALIIAAIAAIIIAIGGLGGELTKEAYDKKNGAESGGYAPSVMPLYGSPVSSYGSPAVTGPSYTKLAENVDTATQDFNQAYEKYSSLLSQSPEPQQQQQQQAYSSSYTNSDGNQYDGWNNHVVMKRMKLD